MVIREVVDGDFDAVLSLSIKHTTRHYGEPMMNEDYLRSLWQQGHRWLALDEDETLAGYAECLPADEHGTVWFSLYVYSAAVGKALLDLIQQNEASMFKTRLSHNDNVGRRVLEQDGYQSTLSFLTMHIDLPSEPIIPALPDGITLRNYVPGQDGEATYMVDEAASQDKSYYKPLSYEAWRKRMNVDEVDPGIWILACDGDDIVGVALNAINKAMTVGLIDHPGVLRAYRQCGIGEALMLASFSAFYRRGVTYIKLNVEADSPTNAPRLYEWLGMKTIQQYHIYAKELDAS